MGVPLSNRRRQALRTTGIAAALAWCLLPALPALLGGCGKKAVGEGAGPQEVTVITIAPRDTPFPYEFVGQTQSSRQVEIVARVDGFLEKKVYTEGSMVKAGQTMFLQDQKPFQAQVDGAKASLSAQQARLQVARDNLARVKPLAALNALSQKDLDDAVGQEKAASAAVDGAKANLTQAQLNLGYTVITTPVAGASSFSKVQEGQYLDASNRQLTYVSQLDPMWINFSISENDMLELRTEAKEGTLRLPSADNYEVQVILADGSIFPSTGRITFANADFNPTTGTFLLRATVTNPDGTLRPGQFVRVRINGAVRPNAILVPQKAVLEGAQGKFVVLVDKDHKAQIRPVKVGPWLGEEWIITDGLAAGDVVVVDGMSRLGPGTAVKIIDKPA